MITNGGTVRAIFDYTRDTGMEPEIYFYEPPNGDEPRRPGDEPREMTVHNGWDRASVFSPDREGPWPGRNRRSCCRRRVPLVEQGRRGRVRFASGRAHVHGAALGDAHGSLQNHRQLGGEFARDAVPRRERGSPQNCQRHGVGSHFLSVSITWGSQGHLVSELGYTGSPITQLEGLSRSGVF